MRRWRRANPELLGLAVGIHLSWGAPRRCSRCRLPHPPPPTPTPGPPPCPVSIAVVKVLQLLPPAAMRFQLPRTLQKVANLLKARMQSSR